MQINNKKIIIPSLLIIGFIISLCIYMIYTQNTNEIDITNMIMQEETIEDNTNNIFTNSAEEEEVKMIIHISGEVKNPGIVTLEMGSRIMDAIKKAGGATSEADLTQVNLAYELQDGQKVYIPNKKEQVTEYITESSGNNVIIDGKNISNNEGNDTKVNINSANLNELDSLPGIGPALAQRIIDYREQNGNFQSIEDLQNVKGIGDSKFSDIKDNITV